MLQYEELRLELLRNTEKLQELQLALGLEAAQAELLTLEASCAGADFWDDAAAAQDILQQISRNKAKLSQYETLRQNYEDALALIELANEAEDEELFPECQSNVSAFISALDACMLSTLLTGEYDASNAILSFHAGAGGTEAQDWTQMLVRMYTRWTERHGFQCQLVDFLDGEEAGFKSAVLLIKGENAYGYLKGEHGVHRLVRCSPFDSSGRRHTSFASLEVLPELTNDTEIEINPEDLQMDVYRASGAGGQKVNKTSSAVRLTHLPTGIVACCQIERSQHQNREVALRMLKSKLIEQKERAHLEKIEDLKGVQMEIAWGSQIRSYVFMPYTLAKDHRTKQENGNILGVMDGDLDSFIQAYLIHQSNS